MALVGYTNVGKSSLLAALYAPDAREAASDEELAEAPSSSLGESALVIDDAPFATLDPLTRRVRLSHPAQRLRRFQ